MQYELPKLLQLTATLHVYYPKYGGMPRYFCIRIQNIGEMTHKIINPPHHITYTVVPSSGIPRGGGSTPPLPKFRRPTKIVPNSTRFWKLLKIAEFRTPTPQDVRRKGSKILKLPSVRNCFTLPMTNKLVVIINSLKVPKIKKILLYEMKFLVLNYSCLQNPWLGGYRPQIPVLSVLN